MNCLMQENMPDDEIFAFLKFSEFTKSQLSIFFRDHIKSWPSKQEHSCLKSVV